MSEFVTLVQTEQGLGLRSDLATYTLRRGLDMGTLRIHRSRPGEVIRLATPDETAAVTAYERARKNAQRSVHFEGHARDCETGLAHRIYRAEEGIN